MQKEAPPGFGWLQVGQSIMSKDFDATMAKSGGVSWRIDALDDGTTGVWHDVDRIWKG